MHSTIFQVSKQKMEKDDHLSNYDIADYDYGKFGIDWVGDEREDEDGFNSFVNATPSELFTVNRDNRCHIEAREFWAWLRRLNDGEQEAKG